jgi:hypothetical protein
MFSRSVFERAVVKLHAERHTRGFSCGGQFVAMLFCHLGRAQSLRGICGGLAASKESCGIEGCRTLMPSNWRSLGESNLDSTNANLKQTALLGL